VKSFCNDETFLKQSCSSDNDNNVVSTHLLTKFINCQQPALMMLPSVISEGVAPNIMVTIQSVQTPMMLDSGAEVSVLPLTLFQSFYPAVQLPSSTREVRTFGNSTVTLMGPLPLEMRLCGMCITHPFYIINESTPVIVDMI